MRRESTEADPKPVEFVGSARKDLRAMPTPVRYAFGKALLQVQLGDYPPQAKPLKGFSGAGVLELMENHDGDTYRAVYTVRFAKMVYVLHVFQKKSKSGIATPQRELDVIAVRLQAAENHYAENIETTEQN